MPKLLNSLLTEEKFLLRNSENLCVPEKQSFLSAPVEKPALFLFDGNGGVRVAMA